MKRKNKKPTYVPVPFTRAHSKPKRLEEFSRERRKMDMRNALRGQD